MQATNFASDDVDFPCRRRQQQLERAAASLLGELAHGDERHEQDQLHGRLKKHAHQGRLLGDDQRDGEGVAAQHREHRDHRIGDRRGEKRADLLADQRRAAPSSHRLCLRQSRNRASRSRRRRRRHLARSRPRPAAVRRAGSPTRSAVRSISAQDVGCHEHGAVLRASSPQQPAQLDDLPRVQAVARLVEHQQFGLVQHGLGERHALPVAARQPPDDDRRTHRRAPAARARADGRARLSPAEAAQPAHEGEELADAHVPVERRILRHVADALRARPVRRARRRSRRPAPIPALGRR